MSVALNRAVRYGIHNYLRAAGILLLVMLLIPLALWVMLAGTVADLINQRIDPRLRLGGAK